MAVQGYCCKCCILVNIVNPQTVRLINKQYVIRGICPTCNTAITKTLNDAEILVVPPGNYLPKEVYVGSQTPEWVQNHNYGQQIINDGNAIQKPSDIFGVKTLKQIKEELNAKKNNVNNP